MPHAALRELVDLAGLPQFDPDAVVISGSDPVFPTTSSRDCAPRSRLRHPGPVLRLAETLSRWARPPVPLDNDPPIWPAR
jgi:hypothetical protein